jgi:hypothetical protein
MIGFIAAIEQLIPILNINFTIIIISCFLISFVSVIITNSFNIVENIPIDEFFLSDSYKILFPYEKRYLLPINKIAKKYFGKINPNISILESWYRTNPYTLVTLADNNGRLVGYFDILPLKDSFAVKFINGKVSEKNISRKSILPIDKMYNAKYIYISGIAIHDIETKKIIGGQFIYVTLLYIQNFYNAKNEKFIFAIAATKCGERALKKLGFHIESYASERTDKTDLYAKIIDNDIFDKVNVKLYSNIDTSKMMAVAEQFQKTQIETETLS